MCIPLDIISEHPPYSQESSVTSILGLEAYARPALSSGQRSLSAELEYTPALDTKPSCDSVSTINRTIILITYTGMSIPYWSPDPPHWIPNPLQTVIQIVRAIKFQNYTDVQRCTSVMRMHMVSARSRSQSALADNIG